MGHSVGGAVVTLYTEEKKPKLAGLVLLAPAIRVNSPILLAAATPMTALLNPNFPAVDVPNAFFTRDPAQLAEMDKDPLIYQPVAPARTGGGIVAAIEKIWAHPEAIDMPLLALHGTADKATDPRGSVNIVDRAGSHDKKLLLYKGLYHDLFHEPEHDQVMADVFQWLKARL
jgi:alpha-beta hydrolase superfamily lysophospholipase